ncbi:hypothetical protein [Pyxidicoccus sp. MSG2]|uniref:hypothetical protein n=1 Tax=Pyxidicoccus sp. MSG2 TaxID=2996790 RepID=UPI00226DD8D1|nr:hypothetical protein [Pyxidicoccus sp. MSG2]MCY1022952.1 hypothetical protein [Pyxidicoccus sp. MSG2]
MRPESLRVWLLSTVCVLAACSEQPDARVVDAGSPVDGQADGGASSALARSSRNNLRFKGPERLTLDFAAALALPVDAVCKELGQYPCATVHGVTLGGVEPYNSGLYEPLPATGVTTPIAVDRVALSACARRVGLDVGTPSSAVIFTGITLDAQGRLVGRDGAPVRNAITSLYQRGLLRDPTEAEVEALLQLAASVEATGSPTPGRDWMTAACFAVLSSAESVFF